MANIVEEAKLGGPQLRIITVATELSGDIKTTVIMPRENSEQFRKKCDELNIPYKCFWMSRITKEWKVALRYILFFPYEVISLAVFFKKEQFDIIHVSGGSWQYKGVIAGKLARRKILWHLNDTYMPTVFKTIFKTLSFMADGYIYSAYRSKDYYKSLVKKKKPEFVIPPPVNTNLFNPGRVLKKPFSFAKWRGKIIIGTVANINPIKDIGLLIKAAAILEKKYEKQLFFVVVGPVSNTQKKYYKELLKLKDSLFVSNIEFIGAYDNVPAVIQYFDIYICTSLSESGPMSLFEAMAMGKPIVTTNVGDITTYIRDTHDGYIIKIGDYHSLARKLTSLISTPSLREKFGLRVRKIAIDKLDIKECATKHQTAYREIYKLDN